MLPKAPAWARVLFRPVVWVCRHYVRAVRPQLLAFGTTCTYLLYTPSDFYRQCADKICHGNHRDR
jgi:hypothetical protein